MTTTKPVLLDADFPLPRDEPFTARAARAAGVPPRALSRLVASGHLRRPVQSVYVATQCPDTRELRARVMALIAPRGSVVCDWTAAWFWTGVDHPLAHTSVPAPDVFKLRGHDRIRNGLARSGERWLLPADVVPFEGDLMVTTPLRTAWDLGRFSPRLVAIGGMDALLRTAQFSAEDLMAGVERFRRQRGVVQLRHLAPLVNGLSESPGESALRLRWLEMSRLPAPECQVPVLLDGREIYRLDLGVRELLFGGEYDGERWHSTPEQIAHDQRRRAVLRDEFGWHVEVFTRADVFGHTETASARLAQGLHEARRTLGSRLAAL